MRLLSLGLVALLVGCATSVNHYTQTVQTWRGANIAQLMKQWGPPDERYPQAGNLVYVYKSQSYRPSAGPANPNVGVHFATGSKPFILNAPNTNNTWNRGMMTVTCTTAFLTNTSGTILATEVQGTGCYGSEAFETKMRYQR